VATCLRGCSSRCSFWAELCEVGGRSRIGAGGEGLNAQGGPGGDLTWVAPGHFYSPIPSADDIAAHRRGLGWGTPRELPGIELREEAQLTLLARLRRYYPDQPWSPEARPDLRYYFENDYFSYADAIFLHCMLRDLRPRRIVEVGAGFSTAAMLDTLERFLDADVQLTCVEPHPERLESLTRLGDETRLDLIRKTTQEVPREPFSELGRDDLLFVDSTHVSKLRSDVNRLVLDVLPSLAAGVVVHFHDVFWPFEYPPAWVEENRAWNEMYLLRAFLCFNPAFEIVLFNHLIGTRHREVLARDFPLCTRNIGGSLWLRRAEERGDR
jgi:predicted O-methyltransferase YrrM